MYGWPARVWWVTASNQQWSSLNPPINTPHTTFDEMEIKKWGLPSYSAPKFILRTVERERWGSKGRRSFWLVRSPLSSSSVKALPESVQVRWCFSSSSLVEWRSSTRILQFLIANRLLSPSGVLESQLVKIIRWHYLRVGDLPIIVSHSFAALILFVHLHTV
jgi:hypothetical protein